MVRNDFDGCFCLNVNIFDGNIIVIDFGDILLLGNIQMDSFFFVYEKWRKIKFVKELNCYCLNV